MPHNDGEWCCKDSQNLHLKLTELLQQDLDEAEQRTAKGKPFTDVGHQGRTENTYYRLKVKVVLQDLELGSVRVTCCLCN